MTISGVGVSNKNSAVRRLDRGGNIMNLPFIGTLINSGINDKGKNNTNRVKKAADDYGYELYQSLEYNIKHVKSVDEAFKGNPLYITITR